MNHSESGDIDKTTPHTTSWLEWLGDFLAREPKNREQLLTVLRDAAERDILSKDVLGMIERVLQVSDHQVRDVMVPRAQMIGIDKSATLATILPTVIESGHSRFPIMQEQTVIGILLAKDLLAYSVADAPPFRMEDVLRATVFVPQSKRLDILLREFRVNRNHLAVVIDEYGQVAGLVTIEDVLEEIVGEIADEYDIAEEDAIREREKNVYIVKAKTPIVDFNARFNTNFSDTEFDTMGGLVLQALGHLPHRGESVQINDYQFKVSQSDSRRVHLLEVRRVVEE